MAPRDSLSIVRTAYEAFNQRDLERAAQQYAEDVELKNIATGDVYRGREGYLQFARAWEAAFPDGRIEIVHLGGSEETVSVEFVSRGTHTGALISSSGHVPPTWTQVELRFCDVLQLRDGLIRRAYSYFDSATMLRQMGLFPNSPIHPPERRAPLELYALETAATPEQRNKAVVHWFLHTVINQHNAAAAADFCVSNIAWHGGTLGETRDLASYQRTLASLFASFPDLRVEVQDSIAEENRVATRFVLHGTHLGEFQGIPATGKQVSGGGTSTYRVVDGKIVEEWWQHDLLSVLKQLDALPQVVRPLSKEG